MATIEERAKVCADNFNHPAYESHFVVRGYLKGAAEQQKIDIDKACEWFRNEIDRGKGASVRVFFIDSVDRFRKAMEE